jgi:hypothetical protein
VILISLIIGIVILMVRTKERKELLLTDIRIHSFVQLLGYMRVYFIYHTDKLKVLLSGAHANDRVPSVPNYSIVINRLINKLDIKINERIGNDIVIVLDSIRIKVTNKDEWLLPPTHKMRCEKMISQDTCSVSRLDPVII